MDWTNSLKTAADLGTALTGAASVLGVVLGAFGFRAWRMQKRHERRSDAAVRVYELITRATDGLHYLASPVVIGAPGTASENKDAARRIRTLAEERAQHVVEELRALDEAASIAGLLLDGRHEFIVDGLRAVRRTIRTCFALCALHIEDGKFDDALEAGKEAWGPGVRERIDGIRISARDALKPVAQYHSSPLLSTIVAAQRRRLREWLFRRRLANRKARIAPPSRPPRVPPPPPPK